MSQPDSVNDLALSFAALNDRIGAASSGETFQRLVDLAVLTVPACNWAAVTTWPTNRKPRSLATSDDVATIADQLQYDVGEGPCLSAAAETAPVHIRDVSTEQRWPAFCAVVLADTSVRSVLSFPIADQPHRAALNLYGAAVDAFDTSAINLAALFAAHARVVLAHTAAADKAANLETALTTSRRIGAAIGILMNVHKITAEQAFDLLRVSSQHLHRKLHDVAEDVTHTGALPDAN